MLATSLAALAFVCALAAVWIAAYTWRHAPGARLWAELRLRVEDLEIDNERLHERHHRHARQGNIEKATVARVEKQRASSTVLDEAAAVLATAKPGAAPGAQRSLPLDEEARLIELRRIAGIH